MTVLADLAAAVERGWRFGAKTGIASITCSIDDDSDDADNDVSKLHLVGPIHR